MIGPKRLVFVVLQRHARDRHPVAPVHGRVFGERPRVDRRRRGDHLERRAGRVAELRRAIDQRLAGGVLRQLFVRARRAQVVRVVGRRGGHHAHRAAARFQRHDRAFVARERLVRDLLRGRVERREDVVALAFLALQLIEDRLQVRARLAAQRRVAIALQPRPPQVREVVADRVRELVARRVAAFVDAFRAAGSPRAHAAREHRAVRREDPAAGDPFLLQQRARVQRVAAQRRRFEDRPPRREREQDREHHDHHAEQAHYRLVHSTCPNSRLCTSVPAFVSERSEWSSSVCRRAGVSVDALTPET